MGNRSAICTSRSEVWERNDGSNVRLCQRGSDFTLVKIWLTSIFIIPTHFENAILLQVCHVGSGKGCCLAMISGKVSLFQCISKYKSAKNPPFCHISVRRIHTVLEEVECLWHKKSLFLFYKAA